MNDKNSIRPAQHKPLQHKSPQPPEPREPGELGLGLSEDDASLLTRMKEEPLVNGNSNSKLEEKMDIIRNNLHNIQSRVPEKEKKGKRWYYGPPKHTREDQFKKIASGSYTDPRTRTRRSKYSLPPKVVRDVNTPKKNPLEEHKRPSRAKHPKAKRGRPPKKKLSILVNNFTDSALEHNYLDATEKKKLSIRLQDIMEKIKSDTNLSFVEDIKNVVQNELFKGVSNYNISGDYSEQENNLIEEVKDIMKEIRPYVLIDRMFFKHIGAVIRELQLDPNILSIRLQDIMEKIKSDTNSSFVEDIKNVVQNELFKGVSNYNISGDYSEQENNLIEEVKDIMKEIRPYVLIDRMFFKHIGAVIRELQLDPNITLEESTPEYDPRNRILYNPKFNENDFFDDMNQIKQNNNTANRTKNTNNRQLSSSYAYAPRVQSEEKIVPKLLITYPKLLRAVSRGLISSSRLDALDLNNTEELTEILNEVEQINKKISL